MYVAWRAVRQSYARVNFIPQSRTMNLATDVLFIQIHFSILLCGSLLKRAQFDREFLDAKSLSSSYMTKHFEHELIQIPSHFLVCQEDFPESFFKLTILFQIPFYWAGQYLGAFLAALVLWGVYADALNLVRPSRYYLSRNSEANISAFRGLLILWGV